MERSNALFERIKAFLGNEKKRGTLLIGLWLIVVVLTLFSYRDSLGRISSGNEFSDSVVELVDGVQVVQVVPVEEDAEALAIKLATYARKNSGSMNIKVTGTVTKRTYADKDISIGSLQDNAFVVVPLDRKLTRHVDPRIRITISSPCQPDNAAGVYYSAAKAFEFSEFSIGGEELDGDLTLRFLKDSPEMKLFYRIVIAWVIVTFTLILALRLFLKPKLEILFTVIAVCFGLTFWLIITPMSVPDETIHYEYSFQLSNYIMGAEDHLVFNEEYQNYGAMAGHQNISAAYERFIKRINRPMQLRSSDVKMRFDIDNSYKSCFIPQALGITLARLLNWNMLRTFYLGRLFNLIFYVACVYIAIKNAPVHRMLFGILATLPIFMQQAASFSYDCYINGLTFVIIAFLMKWLHSDEMIKRGDFIVACIANLMIAPIKVVYGLFTFLYWFVPQRRFGNRRSKIIALLILTAPAMYQLTILLAPLIFRVFRKIFENVFALFAASRVYALENGGFAVKPMLEGEIYNFSYVMAHPMEMLMLFLRTVRYSIKTWFYASFGRALSGNTLILPTWMVHSLLALLVFASIREEKTRESLWFKIASFVLCVFAGIMMVGGMLISWTEVEQVVIEDFGGPIIKGIQGRYFSPLLPYLFIILHNNRLRISKRFDDAFIYIFVLLVFEVVVYVLSYTFMH